MSHVLEDTVKDLYQKVPCVTDEIKDTCARLETWSSIRLDTLNSRLVAETKTIELIILAKCLK